VIQNQFLAGFGAGGARQTDPANIRVARNCLRVLLARTDPAPSRRISACANAGKRNSGNRLRREFRLDVELGKHFVLVTKREKRACRTRLSRAFPLKKGLKSTQRVNPANGRCSRRARYRARRTGPPREPPRSKRCRLSIRERPTRAEKQKRILEPSHYYGISR
jgi:hypothetical protein